MLHCFKFWTVDSFNFIFLLNFLFVSFFGCNFRWGICAENRNNEKRKEKSRDAARCRRSRETEIFTELGDTLPVRKDELENLDKSSVMRLAIATLKIEDMLPLCKSLFLYFSIIRWLISTWYLFHFVCLSICLSVRNEKSMNRLEYAYLE